MKTLSLKFRLLLLLLAVLFAASNALAQTLPLGASTVSATKGKGAFTLAAGGKAAAIYASASDWPGVLRAAKDLQADVQRVTKIEPRFGTAKPTGAEVVLIGTIGKSPLIDQLVQQKKLDVKAVAGRWETFVRQVVENPMPGVERALVIAGSDKRGTIFGIYDLSQQIGVSPWYWWADVPVKPQNALYVSPARYTLGEPAVKYRGIFLNDEAPALSGWAKEKFGGINSKMYVHVFELILRLKGNYLWPAMWGNAFNDDDKQSPVLADEYGIVMGTSHHEPMLRAQQEWKRYGKGAWNYQTNDSTLREFWRQGIKNMGTHESIVTVGMRGDGDEPMSEGSNIALLEKIVADQRKILAQETHKPAAQTPQLWALYKEVQDYYDKGMRVPDDVTLLLCDDNWGNIRKLPKPGEKPRQGGYGIYYHFDYVGGPRNYKWVNTNPLPRIWEQMHLAKAYGADQIWIVNVGDLKPMELPISFFLDYAWNPDRIPATGVAAYTQRWAAQQFGPTQATEIGDILAKYAKYNARRKPELLTPETYNLATGEWVTVVSDYNQLLARAEAVNQKIPAGSRDAYYELVLHPVQACANLNELYYTVALNRQAAQKSQPNTNELAEKVKALFAKDAEITRRYHAVAGGKWNHMMDQTHIGYTNWQQPPVDKMPEVQTLAGPATAAASAAPVAPATTAKPSVSASPGTGFVENDGYVSIEAEHYTKAVGAGPVTWQHLPDLGRTLGGVTTFPVTAAPQTTPSGASPHLEYQVTLKQAGPITVRAYFAPTLDFTNTQGLRYAVSIDDEAPQIINLHTGLKPDNGNRPWEQAVADNIIIKTSQHNLAAAGPHVLKFWRVDPGVVLEKLVVHRGELPASYLGPPESPRSAAPAPGKGSVGSR
ncbi:glycosyl hydrolase 115 family protein [Hymenobacter sp. BT770]|uniref:glycosyl hydrolase 115 family protein n=1 Tax=Hymenobacter sp. BT770 TaxID=2886942 RepID=UPI001D12FE08|nr:glycosyl hydrolase 115 family protein [Hymenobacter sp. BT770]MCC3153136.1 glycosyl hydrolase 115 family protein [Hymenobacter sp. BT770]MDO3415390.1 glycosyl hydrolase 115 family protein [Hymenobacter sp. BT770]